MVSETASSIGEDLNEGGELQNEGERSPARIRTIGRFLSAQAFILS